MTYEAKPLFTRPKNVKGISEKVLVSHYENNYVGAVKRLNAIGAQLAELDFAKASNSSMVNGLKREELIAANSMILPKSISTAWAAAARRAVPSSMHTRDFGKPRSLAPEFRHGQGARAAAPHG